MNKEKTMKLNQSNYSQLGTHLRITGIGFENLYRQTPVMSVHEYLNVADPFDNELIIIPDGRIIPAQPSHSYVLDSLLNLLYEEAPLFPLSPYWLIEERLYHTGAIQVWQHNQTSYSAPTQAQIKTLGHLVNNNIIRLNYEWLSEEKRQFFESNYNYIHKEAILWNKQHPQNKIQT